MSRRRRRRRRAIKGTKSERPELGINSDYTNCSRMEGKSGVSFGIIAFITLLDLPPLFSNPDSGHN
jgi:hypothetical protein